MLKYIYRLGAIASNTNFVPISVFPIVLGSVLFINVRRRFSTFPKLSFWTILFLFYCLLSGLIYAQKQIIDPSFYRYDGNLFVSFLPLAYLPFIRITKSNNETFIKYFVLFSCLISGGYGLYQFINANYVTGFFFSVNGFTGFLMILLCFSLAYCRSYSMSTRRLFLIISIVILCVIILAKARASLLGVILAFLYINYLSRFILIKYAFIISIPAAFAVILSFSYPVYVSNIMGAYDHAISLAAGEKTANIFIRVFENWPRGLHLFLNSPIWGSGLGSANDVPFKLDTFSFNQYEKLTFNSAHAHNTYLHFMGELGLVGLILFLIMLRSLLQHIKTKVVNPLNSYALQLAFWSLCFASFAEHRWPSPSNVFPFLFLFGLTLGKKNEKTKPIKG